MTDNKLHLNIQTKLSIFLIFITTTIFLGFAILNHINLSKTMKDELKNQTDFLAMQLAESLKMPLWDLNTELIKEITNSSMIEKELFAIVVKGENGNILYGQIRNHQWEPVKITENSIRELENIPFYKTEPIKYWNKTIGYIEVYFSPIVMNQKLRNETIRVGIIIITLNIALIISLVIGIRKTIVVPVRKLVKSVRTIATGNLDCAVSYQKKDEIGQLASDIESMRIAIKELTERLKEEERLKNEMELAKKIQTVLVPKSPVLPGYEIVVSYEPADEVGGDYYDIISVQGYDWIIIGDVSGHGLTSGLIMMMVQTAIHTALIQNPQVPPEKLLSVINRTIYENLARMDEQKHMTIVVIAFGKDGFFDFSGLHEDILLWCSTSQKVEKIETNGMWIGLEPDISEMVTLNEFHIENGDCLILYTDGIIEALDKDGNFYGLDRLISVVESCGHQSAQEIHKSIMKSLSDYEKPDDITLIVIKRL